MILYRFAQKYPDTMFLAPKNKGKYLFENLNTTFYSHLYLQTSGQNLGLYQVSWIVPHRDLERQS